MASLRDRAHQALRFDDLDGRFDPILLGIALTLAGLLPDGMRVTRSLRQAAKRYVTTVDAAFDQVISRCADPSRPSGWIDGRIVEDELNESPVAAAELAW